MPSSRPADYYLVFLDGCIFIDFNRRGNLIALERISFDGYGCCNVGNQSFPMDEKDSMIFKKMMNSEIINQDVLTTIVKKTIADNKHFIWEDALKEYKLI